MAIKGTALKTAFIFRKTYFLAAIVCAFVFYSGLFKISPGKKASFLFSDKEILKITGEIKSSPSKTSSGKYYSCNFRLLQAEGAGGSECDASGFCTVFIPAEYAESYFPGKLYSPADGSGKKPSGMAQEGKRLYETGGIITLSGRYSEGNFYATDASGVKWKKGFRGKIAYFRALCRLQFKRLLYGWGNAGGLLLALLCGAREYTESSVSASFRNAGLSHILALSGMHLSLFSGIAGFAGDKLKSRNLSVILRILIVCIFVWFAGFSPSLLRAFLCTMISIIAGLVGVKIKFADVLSLSFLIQSAVCPGHIYNVGFLLSYGALAGITAFSSLFDFLLVRFLPAIVSSSLSSSCSAQIFTAPISMRIFGSFAPIGVIATSVVSPLITFFIYSGLVLIIISMIFPIFQFPSGIFMNFLYTIIKNLVIFFAKAPVLRF